MRTVCRSISHNLLHDISCISKLQSFTKVHTLKGTYILRFRENLLLWWWKTRNNGLTKVWIKMSVINCFTTANNFQQLQFDWSGNLQGYKLINSNSMSLAAILLRIIGNIYLNQLNFYSLLFFYFVITPFYCCYFLFFLVLEVKWRIPVHRMQLWFNGDGYRLTVEMNRGTDIGQRGHL